MANGRDYRLGHPTAAPAAAGRKPAGEFEVFCGVGESFGFGRFPEELAFLGAKEAAGVGSQVIDRAEAAGIGVVLPEEGAEPVAFPEAVSEKLSPAFGQIPGGRKVGLSTRDFAAKAAFVAIVGDVNIVLGFGNLDVFETFSPVFHLRKQGGPLSEHANGLHPSGAKGKGRPPRFAFQPPEVSEHVIERKSGVAEKV